MGLIIIVFVFLLETILLKWFFTKTNKKAYKDGQSSDFTEIVLF